MISPNQAVEAAERSSRQRRLLQLAKTRIKYDESPLIRDSFIRDEFNCAYKAMSLEVAKELALLLASPLEVAASVTDAKRDAVMRHDFPALQQFHSKHAMGPLAAPSCLCCGQSTQGAEIGVQHLELPGIVICKSCKIAASRAPVALGAVHLEGIIHGPFIVRATPFAGWKLTARFDTSEQAEAARIRLISASTPPAQGDAKDAERYRFLRDVHVGDDPDHLQLIPASRGGLDDAIDAAIEVHAARLATSSKGGAA